MDKSKQASRARERRLRAKYRKNIRVAIIICLILGLAAGFVAGRVTADKEVLPTLTAQQTPTVAPTVAPTAEPTAVPTEVPTAEPTATPVPTVEPTEVPTAQSTQQVVVVTQAPTSEPVSATAEMPTAEPTAEVVTVTATEAPVANPTAEPGQPLVVVVPFGETQVIPVQMLADGSPRKDDGALPYETVNFALRVNEYLNNEYYVETYGSTYKLDPGTAGVEFELMVQDYMGDVAIDPNKLLRETGVETNDNVVSLGFQFYDAAIAGSNEINMTTNVPMMIYKRYTETSAQPMYLTATVYSNGVPQVYKFELGVAAQAAVETTTAPEATEAPVYTTMRVGDTGDSVKQLQEKLIEEGYLAEGSADGDYGNKTAEAVKKAQADLNLDVDGIAGPKFLSAFMAS